MTLTNDDLISYKNGVLNLFHKFDKDSGLTFIRIQENDTVFNIYTCEQTIRDVRFLQQQSSDNIMLTWVTDTSDIHGEFCIYFLELNSEFALLRLAPLYSSKEKMILPLATQFGSLFLLSAIDIKDENVVLNLFDIISLQKTTNKVVINDKINANYLHSSQTENANLTTTVISDNSAFVLFLGNSGTMLSYQITINKESHSFSTGKGFSFAFADIGYHNAIYNSHNNHLLVIYSEVNGGDIFAISQPLFSKALQDAQSVQINQSVGAYLCPAISIADLDYIIFWQGDKLRYCYLDESLNHNGYEEEISEIIQPTEIKTISTKSTVFSCLENYEHDSSIVCGKMKFQQTNQLISY